MLRALRCVLTADETDQLTIAHWSGAPADLQGAGAAGAYVVSENALTALKTSPLVTDRGKKHRARSLSSYLLGQPRVPAIFAAFRSHSQVTNSIRTLLENANASRRRERKAYVVGVPLTVFEMMAARVAPTDDDERDEAVTSSVSAAHFLELLEPEETPRQLNEEFVGDSVEMQVVRQQIVRAARADVPVLVQGDTGTGKELVARWIHQINPGRSRQPFVSVNCGAIPTHLFESDLFGYVGGAFTDALRQGSEGLWRSAEGGTIFLDEIGDLAPLHQVKLLRVLEKKEVKPVGSSDGIPVSARVVAATNRDLYSMKESGEFREDLYYRLAGMVINLPTLRDRAEDVARLAGLFWKEVAPNRPPLSAEVLRELGTYRWNGNARELRYIVMNLHLTFQKSIPNVERVRALVRLRAPSAGRSAEDGPDRAVRQVDRLRHLGRAKAAIDACLRLVRRFGRRGLDADERARAVVEIGGCLSELQILSARPERFEKVATFEAMHTLAGGVAALQSLIGRNEPQAGRYGSQELATEVAAAAAAVRRDEERILKSL